MQDHNEKDSTKQPQERGLQNDKGDKSSSLKFFQSL
jgi:hypothetical protein